MNKIIIGYTLLIIVGLITALIGVMKRRAMLNIGELNYSSPKFWFTTLTNPYIIGIFCISVFMFALTLVIFATITADNVYVVSWTLIIPEFILTILFNSLWLGEKINPSKYPYLAVLFLSVLISIYGAWGYFKS